MTTCRTCELIARRDSGGAPLWDLILRTQYWDVVHNYDTALPGWLCLVIRRHVSAIDELSDAEAVELGRLIQRTSAALKQVVGCVKTYVLQFAENQKHRHVHFHVIPRMANQPEDRKSTQIFGYSGVPAEERVAEDKMNEIAEKVRELLLAHEPG